MAHETCQDEPEGTGIFLLVPPSQNPTLAVVRAYKADAVAILGRLYDQAWTCLQNDAMSQEKVVGLAVEVGKFGMRAKRALLKAAKEVR